MSAGAYGGQKCGPRGAGVTGGFEPPNVSAEPSSFLECDFSPYFSDY